MKEQKKEIESIKGAKGINRTILNNMNKRLKFLKNYKFEESKVPGLFVKETQEEFKNMKMPVEKKHKK